MEKQENQSLSAEFVKLAPKIELHAHLNGCIRRSTLEDFAKEKGLELDFQCFERKDNEGQFCVFDIIHKTVKTLNDIKRITGEVLEDFKQQNVVYLELRTTPKSCENGTFDEEQYIESILNVMKQFNEQSNQTMKSRLILSIDRGRSQVHAQKVYDLLLKVRQTSSYIVGLDYSGNPEKNSFSDFRKHFDKCKEMGIKTTIHAAVIDGEQTIKETKEILEFIPGRVGHFNYFNQELYNMIIEKRIPIELCPTSNYFTKGLANMSEHHFKDFFFVGHPVSLSTDDTGVFDTNSTLEHIKIINTFNLNRQQFKSLLLSASTMIFEDNLKEDIQKLIEDYFTESQN